MTFHVFDLLYTDPDQVREFLTAMAKEGLVGGVYLWINRVNGKKYVGSSINLYNRVSGYLSLSKLHGVIGLALLKYSLDSFFLILFFVLMLRLIWSSLWNNRYSKGRLYL